MSCSLLRLCVSNTVHWYCARYYCYYMIFLFPGSWSKCKSLSLPKGSRSAARLHTLHFAAALTSHNKPVGLKWESSCSRGSLLELICGCTWPSWDGGILSDKCQIWYRWISLLTNAVKCQLPVPLLDGSWKADGSYELLTFKNSLFNTEEAVFLPTPPFSWLF